MNDVKDLAECIQNIGVNELPWKGAYYTWTNKQHGVDRISSKIDRAFGNYEWMMQWGHVSTEYEKPGISDHCPMLLTLQENQQEVGGNFKFFNVWTQHDSFMHRVEDTWKQWYRGDNMEQVWKKLKALQSKLRKLNNCEFKFISQKIEKTRDDLARIQESINNQVTDALIDQEKEKSRAKWIQLGDANNKYFSALIKERTQQKQIRGITALSGQVLYEATDIQNEFVQFYKGLMGSSANTLPAIDIQIMRRGPILSRQQRISL
ncbi:uncharacterized protein LOC129872800 [Solanum dulcamara]|uniref:uncharacterized protein LOC129872800 n=1 Tax=Solanum dulcamara TaxID=45834 RepID=UPI002484EDAE|nr:uncharacterized protein LOC129872800 [Solanum dulcamara]